MSNGLDRLKTRLNYQGYDSMDGRIVKGKYDSFKSALKASYQAEWITLDRGKESERRYRCLINASRLTENFDKKVLSIDYESGVKEGTIFWWDRTNHYWMVNLQQHTEEAYFRGIITRADYQIDIDGETYWAIARGPVEETTEWKTKHQIFWNNLNYSLAVKIEKNSKTIQYFSRHKVVKVKFEYEDMETGETITEYHNWKVVATDKYSSDFLIELYLDEWNDNPEQDQVIDTTPEEPNPMEAHIEGPLTINAYDTGIIFTVVGAEDGTWYVSNEKIVQIMESDDKHCVINVKTGKRNKFILKYENYYGDVIEQEILIQSL